jgi:hypothetical protein
MVFCIFCQIKPYKYNIMKKKTNKFTCNLGHNNINFITWQFQPINYTINQKKNEKNI